MEPRELYKKLREKSNQLRSVLGKNEVSFLLDYTAQFVDSVCVRYGKKPVPAIAEELIEDAENIEAKRELKHDYHRHL